MTFSATKTNLQNGQCLLQYRNDFEFEGYLDNTGTPSNGIIRNPEGEVIHSGLIKGDIYAYFQAYLNKKNKPYNRYDGTVSIEKVDECDRAWNSFAQKIKTK